MTKHQTGINNIAGSKLFKIMTEPEIIEPHPLLIEYLEKASGLFCDFDGSKKEFLDFDEWHYVPSNLEQNIYLLKRLQEQNLLPNDVNICDCGIGLGTTMYDLYLQSQDITDKKFKFTGIEKYGPYIDYFNKHLKNYWNDNLNYISGEIMEYDFSNYNFIYSYSPFKTEEKLDKYYSKLISEIKTGSLLIEFRNNGLGYEDILNNYKELKSYKVDHITVFIKI